MTAKENVQQNIVYMNKIIELLGGIDIRLKYWHGRLLISQTEHEEVLKSIFLWKYKLEKLMLEEG